MSDSASLHADLDALNELIVNCPDFDRIEALLGGFNIFQVLKFEHGEIRHSNVLAWILDPAESHGLDATFLKKWLMRVIHEASDQAESPIAAVDIDGWRLLDVEVRREWQNIDLLLILNFADGCQWTVAIENKINSTQHSNQLARYRAIVESTFPDAAKRLYIFLTKSNEQPEDEHYLPASHTQVHQTLRECLQSRAHAIGPEPKVLLENYLRLLEEKFMDESEIARTAMRIYQQHRRALDVIFEHRPDNLGMASTRIRELLAEHAGDLDIVMAACTKFYIRFIPVTWDVPGNTHGTAWSGSNRTVAFELNLTGKRPYLYVIAAMAPDSWIDPIWERVGQPPFRRPKRAIRPRMWCTLHIVNRTKTTLSDDEITDPNDLAQKIYDWVAESLQDKDTHEVVRIIGTELPKLEALHASPAS